MSLPPAADGPGLLGGRGLLHFPQFDVGLLGACASAAARRGRRPSGPRRKSQRGDSATSRLPITNRRPGGSETQKMLRQAVSLKASSWPASPSFATSSTRMLKYMPISRGGHDAERQQPLENAGALAAVRRTQALREIERDDHADQPGADALQQAAEDQRPVAVRERDHGNAEHKEDAAERHQGLAAHPVGEQAGEQRGDHAAQQHGGHNERKLAGVQAGGGLQIGQRAGDDADIDAVKQAAQAGDEQEEAVVAGLGGSRRRCRFALGWSIVPSLGWDFWAERAMPEQPVRRWAARAEARSRADTVATPQAEGCCVCPVRRPRRRAA